MKITQIKQQIKNPDRVSVFLDGKYSFSLTLDQLLAEKLKKDTELETEQVKRLKKLADEGKLRARSLEWLMGRPYSAREFRDYLYRKKAEKEQIEALTEEFTEKKYLDDETFGRWFAEGRMRKQKSTRAIKAELQAKGLSPITIQNIVTEMKIVDNEEAAIKELVNKLRKRSRYQDEIKLKSYLVSKGFSYDDIKRALSEEQDD